MAVVVDASAIGAIMCGEPQGEAIALHLAGETLLAPALIDVELTNLALTKVRRSPEIMPQMAVSLAAALSLPIFRVAVPGAAVLALASATGLTAYDASYLWLARSRDLDLVTLDKALLRASADPLDR